MGLLDESEIAIELEGYSVRRIEVSVPDPLPLYEIRQEPKKVWTKVWPAAIALTRWLLERPLPELGGGRALELGCGPALLSLALARAGLHVDATDMERGALALVSKSARALGLSTLSARRLEWSSPEGAPSRFIVGSDILYELESPGRVRDLVSRLLEPGGELVLAGPPPRAYLLEELRALLVGDGYAHQVEERRVEFRERVETVAIHAFRRAR